MTPFRVYGRWFASDPGPNICRVGLLRLIDVAFGLKLPRRSLRLRTLVDEELRLGDQSLASRLFLLLDLAEASDCLVDLVYIWVVDIVAADVAGTVLPRPVVDHLHRLLLTQFGEHA